MASMMNDPVPDWEAGCGIFPHIFPPPHDDTILGAEHPSSSCTLYLGHLLLNAALYSAMNVKMD